MGFLDRLKEVAKGVGNLFEVPAGLLWDTTRAISSSEYDPGFFGVVGPATEKAFQGISRIGEASGISASLGAVGKTSVGEDLKSFWNEVELLYSTEFQRQEQQAPWGLRNIGVEPGDLSIQRVGAAGINALGAIRGTTFDPNEWWRRSATQSPGQAIYESLLTDFYKLSPSQQEEVKASAHYNMITGTIDAISRWYLSPDVLLGKGLKNARQARFIFDPSKALDRAKRSLSGSGIRANPTEETFQGLRSIVLEADEGTKVYSVVRSGGLEQLAEEGSLRISSGMDELLDQDPDFIGLDLDDFDTPVDAEALATEFGDRNPGDVLHGYLEKGLSGRVSGAEGGPASPQELQVNMEELMAWVERGDASATREFMDVIKAGGASDNLLGAMRTQLQGISQAAALRRANQSTATSGFLGSEASSLGRGPRYPGTQARPLVLFTNEVEAKRYAASLYESDPSDVPMILDIEANGLQAAYEEFDLPLTEVGGDGAFFTMADKLTESNVRIRRLPTDDLDIAVHEGIADYLEPPDALSTRLYRQDGTAIEPDQAIGFDDLRMDLEAAMRLPPIEAQKFLEAQNMSRTIGGGGFYDEALNSKIVHQVLNHIGKLGNADEIRRVHFPEHPLGQRISIDLASAKTFKDRRTILAAYMGYRLPEVDALPPILRAKIDILNRELEAVKAGRRPNELYLAMIDEPGRFTDLDPEQMLPAVEELLDELQSKQDFMGFLDEAVKAAPLRQVSMPYGRRATNLIRKTSWYQQSSLARPIRVMTEMKPHRYINVRDGLSDTQLVRQLEEAAPLGVTAQETKGLREAYMAAKNDQAKLRIVTDAENLIIEKAAALAHLTKEELEEALSTSVYGKRRVQSYLASRRYAPGERDKIRFVDPETGVVEIRIMPLLDTQIQAWAPMQDVREIIRTARRIGTIREKFGPTTKLPREILASFYAVWKPSVLLRGGWMLRVVSDEQLRILARTGSLLRHLAAIEAGDQPTFSGIFKKDLTLGQRTAEGFTTITGTQPIVAGSTRLASLVSKGARRLRLVDPDYWDIIKGTNIENQVSARATFGGPNETMLHEMQALFGRDEATILDHLYNKTTGQWRSVVAGDREFGPAWSRVLTHQYGNSSVGRKIVQEVLKHTRGTGIIDLDAKAYDQVVANFKRFLSDTREGREIFERMSFTGRTQNLDRWADDLVETLKDYTGGFNDDLMDGILNRRVTKEMMEALPEDLRPDIVHSEIIDQALGQGVIMDFIKDFTSSTFDLLGRLPTDTLSRQPMFKQLYGLEMLRIQRLHAAQGVELTEDIIQAANKSARAYAIGETKKYLYDLAEVSRLGDMMRFVTPFYAAWQEVITVWAGLGFNDPSIIARAKLLWESPNRAGMVYTDDEGNEFIQFRLSEKMRNNLKLTGWADYLAAGGIRLGKNSFNLVLNSPAPGAGPLVQYPVNELVKAKPELEASLKWLLPYGVSVDSSAILLSPLIRQFKSELEGPAGDRAWVRAWTDAITWMDVEYRAGRRTDPPTEGEAVGVAQGLHMLRMWSRFMSPVQPIFDSPMAPYMDVYRDLIETLGPEAADEAFLNEYGQEYFAVTLSRTVSKTGIPPTVEAEVARRQFESLIDKYPEYGRLIVGDQALGEFSTGAYAAQLERPMDPENPHSEMERIYRTTELDPRTGRIIEVDRRLGWQEYIKMADLIDLRRKELGLPNLRVAAAQPLADLRNQMVDALSAKYPAWWDDYNTRNDLKWDKRIDTFREIAGTQPLSERADIQGMSDYLNARSLVLQELNRRKQLGGASSLEATSNMDLANLWETMIAQIIEDNVAFGPLYYRYLEGDTLTLRSGGQ